jgi:hypothetical protein
MKTKSILIIVGLLSIVGALLVGAGLAASRGRWTRNARVFSRGDTEIVDHLAQYGDDYDDDDEHGYDDDEDEDDFEDDDYDGIFFKNGRWSRVGRAIGPMIFLAPVFVVGVIFAGGYFYRRVRDKSSDMEVADQAVNDDDDEDDESK